MRSLEPSGTFDLFRHYSLLGKLENDFRNKNLFAIVCSMMVSGNTLEIGCGAGNLLALLIQRGHPCVGIEPTKDLYEVAKKRAPEALLVLGGGEKVAELREEFRNIIMVDVLEHIEDDLQQLRWNYGCLSQQGRLLIVVPSIPSLYGIRDRSQGHFRRYSKEEISEKLRFAGFEVIKIRNWNALGVFPYWFCEKILAQPLSAENRYAEASSFWGRCLQWCLDFWFRHVESRIDFGFGLSLVCLARRAGNS